LAVLATVRYKHTKDNEGEFMEPIHIKEDMPSTKVLENLVVSK